MVCQVGFSFVEGDDSFFRKDLTMKLNFTTNSNQEGKEKEYCFWQGASPSNLINNIIKNDEGENNTLSQRLLFMKKD